MGGAMDFRSVSVKKMRVFLSVVNNGSFTKAAAEQNMSQPAATIAITQIEELSGTELFARNGQVRTATLTPVGQNVARVFSRVVGGYDDELTAISSNSIAMVQKRKLLVQGNLLHLIDPNWIKAFANSTLNGISIVENADCDEILAQVSNRNAVAGLIDGKVESDGCDYWPIQDYTFDIVVPNAFAEASLSRPSGGSARDDMLCCVLGGVTRQKERQINRYIEKKFPVFTNIMYVDSISLIEKMLRNGSCAAVVPSYASKLFSHSLECSTVSLAPEVSGGSIGLVTSLSYANRADYSNLCRIPTFVSHGDEAKLKRYDDLAHIPIFNPERAIVI